MLRWPQPRGWDSVSVAVAQFAITGLLAVVLLGIVGVQVLRRTGTAEAIRNATEVTRLAGEGIVAPNVTSGVVAGRTASLRRLDSIVRSRVLRDPVVRVKIWDSNSRVLYSDESRLDRIRFRLPADELVALRMGGTHAEVSDLSRPENRFDRGQGRLLEVYHGIRDRQGLPLLFEAYLRFSSVSASGRRLWESFAPALIGGLVLLELVQVPLAWSLARRLRRGQEERVVLFRRSVDASVIERRRIARDLHDGVVQNLAGVTYSLAAARGRIDANGDPAAVGETIDDAARETQRSIRELRTMLVDLYPPDLHRAGLPAALADLLAPFAADSRTVTSLNIDPELNLPPSKEALLYRITQEALRNVSKHADAETIAVTLTKENGSVTLSVQDDGVGFQLPAPSPERGEHFGLRMINDLVQEADGHLAVESAPGGGTNVRVEVPST
ncbi:MAG: sensor histidine kinase [Actinomycetota bacterium]|nr:sensor histidine kinase [Actinomycetota bacterium]